MKAIAKRLAAATATGGGRVREGGALKVLVVEAGLAEMIEARIARNAFELHYLAAGADRRLLTAMIR